VEAVSIGSVELCTSSLRHFLPTKGCLLRRDPAGLPGKTLEISAAAIILSPLSFPDQPFHLA
jgi:hypothetical protein